ncbi:hypothetical protein BJY24_005783 [Nocardia transvalensis]|uniref:DUF8175 domain-containing protein n=1 Tax=Nocardia transvalensis TaxID=37333 RepID=A0A7W9PIN7_9NOCA|nr:hypothetical protein [Nocardia transvalensis]MBB5916871.1 hypothetical protein [Nocardia transvalensis]
MPTRRRAVIILAASIAAVTAAAAAVALTGGNDDTPQATEPATTAVTSLPSSATATRPPTTDLFGNRLDVPADDAGTALPQDPGHRPDPALPDYLAAAPVPLQWQRGWQGAALPMSGSDGPARIDDGIAHGFAQTPQGAALAACDSLARALSAPEGTWQNVVRTRYLGGGQALLDRFARSRTATPAAARYVTVPDGLRVQPGYRPDFAVVEIAVRARDGYAASTWPMAWIDGDWRVRVPDDIDTLWQLATPLATLDGFGQWRTTT